MIDNKFSLPVPYIVSAVFSDGGKHHMLLKTLPAHSAHAAVGMTISEYYMNGGKLPLLLTHVMQVEETTARAAVAAFEEIAAAEKAEAEKVSPLRVVPPPPADLKYGPRYHVFKTNPNFSPYCMICGGTTDALTHNAAAMQEQPPAGN